MASWRLVPRRGNTGCLQLTCPLAPKRLGRHDVKLAAGRSPQRLTALHIDRACNGLDLVTSALFLEAGTPLPDASVRMGPRIGVDYAGAWANHPWRFWVADSAHVSRPRITGVAYDEAMLR